MDSISAQRSGNLQRANWRRKCRHTLASHLDKKLGLTIDPQRVRLKPEAQDGYRWDVLPERQHLFAKQLSKHSISAYVELCREVGHSFEAILVLDHEKDEQLSTGLADHSFSSVIDQMKEENMRLQEEVVQRSQEAHRASEACCCWEQKYQSLETSLRVTRDDLERVKGERYRLVKSVRAMAKKMDTSQQEVCKVLMALRGIDCSASSTQWAIENEDD